MANVFEVLGADHRKVLAVLDELEPDVRSGAAASVDAERHRSVVEQLVIDESQHEAAEEMHFWPAVREHLELGDELAETAVHQEGEGKRLLAELDGMSPADDAFAKVMGTFMSAAREHIAFEQDTVWPRLREKLSTAQQDELGTKIEEAKKAAPTRPHPHTPANPAVLKTAGVGAAAVDKARDAVTDRGL